LVAQDGDLHVLRDFTRGRPRNESKDPTPQQIENRQDHELEMLRPVQANRGFGTLQAAGGDEARVVAAVLVYRLLTFVLPTPVGAVSYYFWRHEVTHHGLAGSKLAGTDPNLHTSNRTEPK
jgi:hypothetical protein